MPHLDKLNSINTYISMTWNDIQHTAGQTSLNLLQIPSNAFENHLNILLGQNASVKQHLHTNNDKGAHHCQHQASTVSSVMSYGRNRSTMY